MPSIICNNAEHSLKANPAKMQVCSFHLKIKEDNRPIIWNGRKLENYTHPKYLGVDLDCSLISKTTFRTARRKWTRRI